MKKLTGLILIIIFATTTISYPQNLTNDQKEQVINSISKSLIDFYVFPEIGIKCANHIKQKLEKGEFNSNSDKAEFANLLTDELQSISHDQHMRVRYFEDNPAPTENDNPIIENFKNKISSKARNFGFNKLEIIDGEIGYIELLGFASPENAKEIATTSMYYLSNSTAIIFDLRRNGGGSPRLVKYILSYFFEKPTHINSIYWRQGDRTEEFWTDEKVEGKKMTDVPLFVLTSSRTFSGGEEFAYDVQTQKRGLIIGETTGGGANPGGYHSAGFGLGVFVPDGRAINPITNTNWEGVGVKPDIEISAEDALDKAIELAKIEAEKYKEKLIAVEENKLKAMNDKLNEAEKLFESGDNQNAITNVNTALSTPLKNESINEQDINALGYSYLQKDKIDMAISIFKFNVDKFPESWNVYDSLAEAYINKGENELAINYYKKSLELNPENENGKQMLKKLNN